MTEHATVDNVSCETSISDVLCDTHIDTPCTTPVCSTSVACPMVDVVEPERSAVASKDMKADGFELLKDQARANKEVEVEELLAVRAALHLIVQELGDTFLREHIAFVNYVPNIKKYCVAVQKPTSLHIVKDAIMKHCKGNMADRVCLCIVDVLYSMYEA